MSRIILESPFHHETDKGRARYRDYLQRCIFDAVARGESPYASHAIFPGALDDDDPFDREMGLALASEWYGAADAVALYVDEGMSAGMWRGCTAALKAWQERRVDGFAFCLRWIEREDRVDSIIEAEPLSIVETLQAIRRAYMMGVSP